MMNAFKGHFYSAPELLKAVYSGRGTIINTIIYYLSLNTCLGGMVSKFYIT